MIISISGMPGSGKSTVAKLLSRRLGMKRYYMGGMRREMARKKGMDIEQLNAVGEKDEWTDREVDDFQRELGRKEDNFIIEGRLSFLFIAHSFKVFLDVDFHVGARRIYEDVKSNTERNETRYKTVEEAERAIRNRMESDVRRYRKYYGIDMHDRSHYNLIIDTTKMTPDEVADTIIKGIPESSVK
jgi:cytidylate kinase